MGAVALTATEASAMLKDPEPGAAATTAEAYEWPDEGSGYPGSEAKSPEYNYPNYDPKYEVAPVEAAVVDSSPDDNGVEALQAGASALGGAGLAFGGMWLYRRRHALAS
jgi:hypothetical protein